MMNVWPETKQALRMLQVNDIPPGKAARIVGGISEHTPASAIRRHALRYGWHAKAKALGVSLSSYFRAWCMVRERLGQNTGF